MTSSQAQHTVVYTLLGGIVDAAQKGDRQTCLHLAHAALAHLGPTPMGQPTPPWASPSTTPPKKVWDPTLDRWVAAE